VFKLLELLYLCIYALLRFFQFIALRLRIIVLRVFNSVYDYITLRRVLVYQRYSCFPFILCHFSNIDYWLHLTTYRIRYTIYRINIVWALCLLCMHCSEYYRILLNLIHLTIWTINMRDVIFVFVFLITSPTFANYLQHYN